MTQCTARGTPPYNQPVFVTSSLLTTIFIRIDLNVKISESFYFVACENIRFSSLFVAGDVSRGGTSATQRQKIHTDDVKSVRNPVRSADWSTE